MGHQGSVRNETASIVLWLNSYLSSSEIFQITSLYKQTLGIGINLP
jgi:hypothetical protein